MVLVVLTSMSGCAKSGGEGGQTEAGSPQGVSSQTQQGAANLNIESKATPEGVTHHFFKAFFSGDDKSAFALLTKKAQAVTRDNFSAQASDTIKWKIRKATGEGDQRQIHVDVEDLNEEGNASREELVFAVKKIDNTWGVSGFSTNGLCVDFEESKTASVPASTENNVQVGQAPTGAKPLK